jgi:hypothetical protein
MKRQLSSLLCIGVCAGGLVLSVAVVSAQDGKQDSKDDSGESSDLFGDIGRWFDKSFSSIGDQFNHEAGVAAKTTAGGVVDAADQVARLPKTRMVSGHQTCPLSDNGAPDCNAAADKLCKAKGLKSGTSLDVTSARECPPRAILQKEARAQCKDVTFVTRAMCQ